MVKFYGKRIENHTGFTIIELVITLVIGAVLMMAVVPSLRSGIMEHRMSALVAVLKTDLEWARNQALSTNQLVTVTISDKTLCHWSLTGNTVSSTAQAAHKMDAVRLANYQDVSCLFVYPSAAPVFNGLGLNNSGGSFTVTISGTDTTRQWLLTLQGSGDLTVVAQ